MRNNLFEGGLLVIAVLFVFLGNLRAAFIVALAIPLSMLFAFAGTAVSKPYRMKIDMKKASAKVASMLPFWAVSAPNVLVSTSGDWWFAKNSRMSAKTSMPEDLGRHADVVEVATRRTPNALMSVVMMSVVMAMNVNMSLTPSGDGLARKSSGP